MPSPVITPNMLLTEPAVGGTLSPSWALLLNSNFVTIDQHNHTNGEGVAIPPGGLNINSDLTFQGNNLLALNSAVFSGAVSGTPSLLSIYSNGTDFFFKDISGNSIQLTKAGAPNAGTGNIQGLPSTPIGGAGISWVNGQSTFQFLVDAGTVGANIDVGTAILRYPGSYPTPSGTNFIALRVPSSISTGYALTLPAALPGSGTKIMQLASSGQISATNTVTDLTSTGNIEVDGSLTIGSSGAVLTNTGTSLVLTGSSFYPGTTANAQLLGFTANSLSIRTAGGTDDLTVAVSPPSSMGSGFVFSSVQVAANGGNLGGGAGITPSRPFTGTYDLNFSPAFAQVPTIVVTTVDPNTIAYVGFATTSSAIVTTTNLSGSNVNTPFNVIVMGTRS